MKKLVMNLQGMMMTEEKAKEYYGNRYDSAILEKVIVDEDKNIIGYW